MQLEPEGFKDSKGFNIYTALNAMSCCLRAPTVNLPPTLRFNPAAI